MNNEPARGNGPVATTAEETVTDSERELAAFKSIYRLGWDACYPIAYRHGQRDADDVWTTLFTGVSSTFRAKTAAELDRIRNEVITQPCAAKCRRCSRCARSLSYWGRSGRDFLGVEAEARLARSGS